MISVKLADFDFYIPEHCLVEVAKQNVPEKSRFCSVQYKYDSVQPATLKVTHITLSPEQLTHIKNTPLLFEVIEAAAKNHVKTKK